MECVTAAAAISPLPALPAFAANSAPAKDVKLVRDTSDALKALLSDKAGFIEKIVKGDAESVPKLPAQIPLTVFQTLEKMSDPEFMDAAIDYAEAYRGARDLYKLAKLTKEKVQVSTKEK